MRACMVAVLVAVQVAGAQSFSPKDAEAFYQRGRQAEQLSDAGYRQWVRTLKVGAMDTGTDRWIFAVDQYRNAVRYNPAHAKAHQRLGFMLAEARGTEANNVAALLHLIAFCALAPNDPEAPRAKDICDQRIAWWTGQMIAEKAAGEGLPHFDPARMQDMIAKWSLNDYLTTARRWDEEIETRSAMATFASGLPDAYAEQVHFNAGLADRVKKSLQTATATGGGEGSTPVAASGGGEGGEGGGTAASGFRASEEQTYRQMGLMASYVSECLGLMGVMHRFMGYLDRQRIAYDPRLPEMLIGHCLVQMRRLFTRGKQGNLAQLRSGYAALAAAGGPSVIDFWSFRDYTAELPNHLVKAGTMEKPEVEEEYYQAATEIQTVRLPSFRYPHDQAAADRMAEQISAAILAAAESEMEFVLWRNVHLAQVPEYYGLASADEVFLRDFARLGAGETSAWVDGPLALPATVAATGTDRDWLFAAN